MDNVLQQLFKQENERIQAVKNAINTLKIAAEDTATISKRTSIRCKMDAYRLEKLFNLTK